MMLAEFPVMRLGDAGVRLYDCEHKTPAGRPSGHPYIAIPNVRDGRLDLSNVRFINDNELVEWNRRNTPQAGDVILTRRGRVGDSAVIPPNLPCAIGQNLVILRSDGSRVDQRFLRWLVRGRLHEIQVAKFLNMGAVFDSLNCADIPRFEVPVPPLDEQRRIAEVLDALDNKIESNGRVTTAILSLCGPLMAGGNGDMVRVGDVATIDKGLSYKGSGLADGPSAGLPMVNLANFNTHGWLKVSGLKHYSADFKPRHVVRPGDLLVANTDLTQQRAILGRPALVPPGTDMLFTHHLYAVRFTSRAELRLPLWTALQTSRFRERAEGFATGTTVVGLPKEALLDFEFSVPHDRAIADAAGLVERAWSAERESVVLVNLRDALLPELLSGRVRVPVAEGLVGAAT